MKPVEKILERAGNVRKMGSGWLVSCPRPDHGKGQGDRDPSVSVTEGDDGRALVKCQAGCETEAVVAAWGLGMDNLFERRDGHGGGGLLPPQKQRQPVNRQR
jgi:putative DNA primase/helicase